MAVDIDLDDEMLAEFREEASENLDEAENQLIKMDALEDFDDKYNSAYRAFHTLKGGAGMFGMERLQKVVHHLETLLSEANETPPFSQDLIDYILRGVDASRSLLYGEDVEFDLIDPEASVPKVTASKATASDQPAPVQKTEDTTSKKETSDHRPLAFIVDDEPDLVEFMTDVLEEIDIRCHGFTNPEEAIRAMKLEKPDIIVSDMQMPEIDGLELLRMAQETDVDVPVVLVSGHLTKENCMEVLNNGAKYIFEKPYDSLRLQAVVMSLIENRQATKLIRKTLKFILFQFSDLDDYLAKTGKDKLRAEFKTELDIIMSQYQKLGPSKKVA